VVLAAPLLGGGAPAPSPGTGTSWLHVRIDEPEKRSRVHLNLPLPAVEAALKAAPDSIAVDGGTPLARDMNVERLRRQWKELATTRDAELVEVLAEEERQHVRKEDGRLVIHLEDDRKAKIVHLDLSGPVVDALLSGGDQELNIRAAVAHLRTLRGEVVNLRDHDATVRVWIDESVGGPEGE